MAHTEQDKINFERWITKRWKTYRPYFNDDVEFSKDEVTKTNLEMTKKIAAEQEYIIWKQNKK